MFRDHKLFEKHWQISVEKGNSIYNEIRDEMMEGLHRFSDCDILEIKCIPTINNVWWHYSRRDMNKPLLTQDMEPMTDQNTDTIKVQIGEPVILLWLLTGMWVENFFNRRRNVCKTVELPKPHPSINDSSWNLETWSILRNFLAALGLNLFQVAQLIFASSRWILWSDPLLGESSCLRLSLISVYSLCQFGEGET